MPNIPLPLIPSGSAEQIVSGEADGAVVRRSVLPGGVRVLTEKMPGLRSVAFGCWTGVGSRDEADGHHGSTHFLEHLLFKGTPRRSAMDIATTFDAIGGEVNAATGKEHTTYYARVLDDDLEIAVEALCDMVSSSTLADVDVETERGVILTELAMHDDDPMDVAHEQFAALVLDGHPLGRPTGGTATTVSGIPRTAIEAHYRRHYQPAGLVVTASGNVDHDRLCSLVAGHVAAGAWELDPGATPWPRRPTTTASVVTVDRPRSRVLTRDIEQANVVLGTTAIAADDDRRYALYVLNAILGGGSSSRLFQEVRERRGLVYDIYAFASLYSDTGYTGVYAGCPPEKLDEVLSVVVAEIEALAVHGPTPGELTRAHGQICGSLVLSHEDSGSRMSRLGRAELVYGYFTGLAGALEQIRSVRCEDVQTLAQDLLGRPRQVSVVGPYPQNRAFPSVLG